MKTRLYDSIITLFCVVVILAWGGWLLLKQKWTNKETGSS